MYPRHSLHRHVYSIAGRMSSVGVIQKTLLAARSRAADGRWVHTVVITHVDASTCSIGLAPH